MPWPGGYVLADLDGEYLNRTVVPSLVSRHFPPGADGYRVAIVSGASTPIYVRGFAPGARVDPAGADVVLPFFTLRIDILRDVAPGALTFDASRGQAAPAPGQGQPSTSRPDVLFSRAGERLAVVVQHMPDGAGNVSPTAVGKQLRIVRPGWRIVLRHASGSLDAAVAQARRRNLWLSFGILGILGAGVVFVLNNARRSGQLAAQQMDFVATVSHELRTPLAVIRSAAQNLSAGVVADPARARRYGQLIEDEGRRLTEMVEQVLEYARIRGERALAAQRPVDLAGMADDVCRSCQPLCQDAGVAIEVRIQPGCVPTVIGDEAALRRALHNLVNNALKHGADGGWIGVSVEVIAGRRRAEVRVAVSDRGPGIDAADLGHVFEPFYRGRKAIDGQVHGNGLGLSLVKSVAETHGGRVTVRSAPGEGSTFALHLPATAPASDDARETAPARETERQA
jgi:signal transduction histidine kinase